MSFNQKWWYRKYCQTAAPDNSRYRNAQQALFKILSENMDLKMEYMKDESAIDHTLGNEHYRVPCHCGLPHWGQWEVVTRFEVTLGAWK